MTTQQFLTKNIGKVRSDGASKSFASVMVDHNGIAYSYGYHYPLAAIIDGIGFVNNSGYSNTTAKHINWARSALHNQVNNVYSVKLRSGRYYGTGDKFTAADMYEATKSEITRITAVMNGKKRKDTQVYSWLQYDLDSQYKTLEAINHLASQNVTVTV